MESQATDHKKIVVYHISDKGLLTRIYKDFSKLNIKKQSNQKIGKRYEQLFHQRGNKHRQEINT